MLVKHYVCRTDNCVPSFPCNLSSTLVAHSPSCTSSTTTTTLLRCWPCSRPPVLDGVLGLSNFCSTRQQVRVCCVGVGRWCADDADDDDDDDDDTCGGKRVSEGTYLHSYWYKFTTSS